MTWNNSAARYSPPTIALHWLTLVLLIGVYACIDLTDLYPKGSAMRDSLRTWHFMLGLTVPGLVIARLAARLVGGSPAVSPPLPQWQARLASAGHVALYALLIAMPVLGWLTLSASGKPIPWFGLELPALLMPDKALARQLKDVHEAIGTAGYFLIGGHAAAALFHHYIKHDNTLLRMLPGRR